MKIGRNDPCRCGSGKKFKLCCEKKGAKGERDWSRLGLLIVGGGLALGATAMVVEAVRSDGMDTSGMVWSAEHGHWHAADGSEIGGGRVAPQPPGPPPPGKVWSPEHNHWHDAE